MNLPTRILRLFAWVLWVPCFRCWRRRWSEASIYCRKHLEESYKGIPRRKS